MGTAAVRIDRLKIVVWNAFKHTISPFGRAQEDPEFGLDGRTPRDSLSYIEM
jgi:hypothetical protein